MFNLILKVMKKLLIIFVLLISFISYSISQSGPVTNKRGVPILPEAGDWAVGIDATPLLEYMGNFFTGGANNAPDFGFTAQYPGSIYFKYLQSGTTIIRGNLLIGVTYVVDKDQDEIGDTPSKLINSALNVGISLGIEKKKDLNNRLCGFYGAQAILLKTPYIDQDFVGKIKYKDSEDTDDNFKMVGGNTIAFGAGVFVGVEYFILPKVSLSGEFSIMAGTEYTGLRKLVPETGDEELIEESASFSGINTMASGDLVLLFYF